MPGRQHGPPRGSSFNSQSTANAQNAALLGAAIAFGRQPPRARAPFNNHGAARDDTAAAEGSQQTRKTPSPRHGTSKTSGAAIASASQREDVPSKVDSAGKPVTALGRDATPPFLAPPPRDPKERSKSPSQKAAQLASAQSSKPPLESSSGRPRARTQHKPSVAPKPRRLSVHHCKANGDERDASPSPGPTPSTASLVNLFEQSASTRNGSHKRPEAIVIKSSRDVPLQSPKPVRVSEGGVTSVFQMEFKEGNGTPKPAIDIITTSHEPQVHYDGHSSSDAYVSASEDTNAPSSPPSHVANRDSRSPSASSMDTTRPLDIRKKRPAPLPSPSRQSSSEPIQLRPPPRSATSPYEAHLASSQSTKSIAAQWHQMHPRNVTPLNTGDALANAIVASSLASSRAPSPRKLEPPPVPTRRQKPHQLAFSRTPSPAKAGMRHTLRKVESEESESEDELHPYGKHKKKRLMRKHPNKHHEGDRKRWREAVTERERKRYEGVWAANKNICFSSEAEDEQASRLNSQTDGVQATRVTMTDQVSNIVVKDIWSRSRLPEAVLEMIWNLVEHDRVGRLGKDEFVVGMWLVDQRLKGRKLPVKVSESVWASVRGLQGIKVRK